MDCKEFEKMIPAFVGNTLEHKQLKKFLMHVEGCPDCKEELTIQVLVSEGMARLEDGSAFDLQQELEKHVQESERRIRMHDIFKYASITIELTALVAIALIIIFFVL